MPLRVILLAPSHVVAFDEAIWTCHCSALKLIALVDWLYNSINSWEPLTVVPGCISVISTGGTVAMFAATANVEAGNSSKAEATMHAKRINVCVLFFMTARL